MGTGASMTELTSEASSASGFRLRSSIPAEERTPLRERAAEILPKLPLPQILQGKPCEVSFAFEWIQSFAVFAQKLLNSLLASTKLCFFASPPFKGWLSGFVHQNDETNCLSIKTMRQTDLQSHRGPQMFAGRFLLKYVMSSNKKNIQLKTFIFSYLAYSCFAGSCSPLDRLDAISEQSEVEDTARFLEEMDRRDRPVPAVVAFPIHLS